MVISKANYNWKRIIVHIHRQLGNLQKDLPQRPSAQLRHSNIGCRCLNAIVWTASGVAFKHIAIAIDWRCLNMQMFELPVQTTECSNIGSQSLNGHCRLICMIIRSHYTCDCIIQLQQLYVGLDEFIVRHMPRCRPRD